MKISFSPVDYRRSDAKTAVIPLENRYFEQNPVLNDTEQGAAMLARPGLRILKSGIGDGPIRGVYSQSGSFDDALFTVSGDTLFRLDKDGTLTEIGIISGQASQSSVSMVATGNIGDTPEFLFIADGSILWVYLEDGFAQNIFTVTGTLLNNDTLQVGTTYYKWTSGSVDAGTPAGTLANPWLVALGGTNAVALSNMRLAIGDTGISGTNYSTALAANTLASAPSVTATELVVKALEHGGVGNSIVTADTSAGGSWAGGTMTGGGLANLTQVPTPDDVGVISLGYITSHVIVVPAQGEGINGRFFWIEPGETTIDPLNFATAESAPDAISQVVVFGDQFWLIGNSTTEVWYITGDPDTPVLRLKGVAFNRGAIEGTAVQVKSSMIIADSDGGVFQIAGGINRISTPQVEERIRVAYQQQKFLGN